MTRPISLFAAAIILLGIGASPADEKKRADDSADALRQTITDLKAKNLALEKKNRELEQELRQLRTQLRIADRQTLPNPQQVPEGWQLREFNGMPYYLVPLEVTSPLPSTRPSR